MARHGLTWNDVGDFEVDDQDGQLFWKGRPVVTERRITLRWFELLLATIASMATLIAALWPIALYFQWIGRSSP